MPYGGKRPQRKLREKLQKLRETALPDSRHLGTDAILFVEAAFAVSGTHRAGGFRMYAGVRDFGAAARSSAKDGIMAIRRRVVFELASAKKTSQVSKTGAVYVRRRYRWPELHALRAR